MIQKFNEFFQFESQKMEDAKVELEHLASNHLIDLVDVGVDIEVTLLNGAEDSLFIKLEKDGHFLKFGAGDQLIDNCVFPLIELLQKIYEVSIYTLDYRHSKTLEHWSCENLFDGTLDLVSFYTIYIRCKIL